MGSSARTDQSATPVNVSTLTGSSRVVSLTGGPWHSCALMVNGSGRCWGYNAYGQLGNGTTTNTSTPTTVSSVSSGGALGAGGYHSCAVVGDGTARCWGYNIYGQLGNGTTTTSTSPVTVLGFP
jgi:alpha-tubulin suppressor-like RCC1 family protein